MKNNIQKIYVALAGMDFFCYNVHYMNENRIFYAEKEAVFALDEKEGMTKW